MINDNASFIHNLILLSCTFILNVLSYSGHMPNIKMEEIRLEEKDKGDAEIEVNATTKKKLLHFLHVMTIEPMMFLQGLGWCMTSISQNQMLLYKTCRGKIFLTNLIHIINFKLMSFVNIPFSTYYGIMSKKYLSRRKV